MTGRPVDHQRRSALLDAVVDYAIAHEFAELTWRPIAGLSLRGDYTYTDAEDDDLHEELLRRPAASATKSRVPSRSIRM